MENVRWLMVRLLLRGKEIFEENVGLIMLQMPGLCMHNAHQQILTKL